MTGAAEVISLPSGGGSLSGIGETFAPDLHTGTGNFSVPIALPPGRNGLQPDLVLAYSTGGSNGFFGLGWSLSLPGVRRRTGRGVPRYDETTDGFVVSGAEDLEPVERNGPLTRYRPRTEGSYARILRHRDGTDDYWQVSSADGLVSTYGTPGRFGGDPAVVADPKDRRRVLRWEITRTADSFGNHIAYEHLRDSGAEGPHHWDQLYPQRIRYVDHGPDPADPQYLVSVNLEYAERPDPFSERRAGFEVRTRLRCTRIVVRSHAGADRMIRSYELGYADEDGISPNGVSLLSRVDLTGHDDEGAATTESMPPLVFGYAGFRPDTRTFVPVRGRELPARSLTDPTLELVDLAGNGLPDLVQLDGVARHWRNLGDGSFDVPRRLTGVPDGLSLADPRVAFADANGDGRADLMVTSGPLVGYIPIRPEVGWDARSFRRFRHAPSFDLADSEVRLVDLDGDGVTDAVRSGSRLECFFNDPVEGWDRTRRVGAGPAGPRFSFADPRVRWADLTGDGLQDVALVHDGSMEYWPNLGHGDWGPSVTMRNAPRFPSGYDPARLLLGDVDGDGLADLVYVGDEDVTLWVNQCGNAWSDPILVRARDGDGDRSYRGTPPLGGGDVRLVDLLGTGMVGVLWSKDARTSGGATMHFLDFTGGVKPYLLERMDNSIGAVTEVEYASSSRFFAEDERHHATRWRTTLPFPVHVVAGSVIRDRFSGGQLHTTYRYRHGHWDGAEKEFRGFAMVEQRDAESRAGEGEGPVPEFFSPPTLSRTWFHAGPVGDEFGGWDALNLSREYWAGDPDLLDPPTLPPQSPDPRGRRNRRDALRALRGRVLRTERYAQDGDPRAGRPFTVTETGYAVQEVEPPTGGQDRLRVFFPHAVAERGTQWERGEDPMTALTFTSYRDRTGGFDAFGRPHASTEVACPRGWRSLADRPGEPFLVRHSRTEYAVPLDADTYLHDRVSASSTYDLPGTTGRTVSEVVATVLDPDDNGLVLDGHTVSHYDGQAFVGLPRGQVGEHGLLVRTASLVLTEQILTEAYGSQWPAYLTQGGPPTWSEDYPDEFRTLLPPGAGYVFQPGGGDPAAEPRGWYALGTRRRYDVQTAGPTPRGLLLETRDPLWHAGDPEGHRATVGYDTYATVPVRATDALGLSVTADYDYRVFQPTRVVDPNGRETRYTFTPLGFLASTAVRGQHVGEGDQVQPGTLLQYAFTAFVDSPTEDPRPIHVRTVRRIHHDTDLDVPLPERDATITTLEFSDGFGRLLQTRAQGQDVRFDDAGEDVTVVAASSGVPNVVVSGHQVHDNKGRVVVAYEPYHSTGFDYAPPTEADFGQRVVTTHDPLGRPRLSTRADGSQELVVRGVPGSVAEPRLTDPDVFEPTPWQTYTYDANDNAGRTHPGASVSYRHHHDTPASVRVDARGRTVEAVARHRDTTGPVRENRVSTTYDSRGNEVLVTDQLGRVAQRLTHDLANRPLRVRAADSGTRLAGYDAAGGVVERRDGRGALVLNGQDRVNRPIRSWARNPAGPLVLVTRMDYGDGGRASQPPGERAAARAAYQLTRPVRQWDGAGRVDLTRYDFTGTLADKSRRVVADALLADGQPALIDWTTPGLVALDPDEFTVSLRFDALGRVRTMTLPRDVEGARRSIVPRYDRAGALDGVALQGPGAGGGAPSWLPFVERVSYDAKGQRVLVVYGNGLLTRCAYDPATRRLARMRTFRFTTPDDLTYHPVGPAAQDLGYGYDLAGNVRTISDRVPGAGVPNTPHGADRLDREFGYDSLYRLTRATGRECDGPLPVPWEGSPRCWDVTRARGYTEVYRYDAAGNLTELKHLTGGGGITRTLTPSADANRLARFTADGLSVDYRYDDNGNLLQEGLSRFFDWDFADRLSGYRTQAAGGPASLRARYVYDDAGQRVKKVVRTGGKVTVTTYIDGVFERVRVSRAGEEARNDTIHVTDDRARVATVRVGPAFSQDATPAVQYHLTDHLGSSTSVVDDAAAPVNREEFTPYGETAFGGSSSKRYRFTGKERDEENGLYYFGFRYYAPWLGRWASADPAGRKDGLNLYQYVRGNPMRLTDATGLQSHDSAGGIGADLTSTPVAQDTGGGPEHSAGTAHQEAEYGIRRPDPEPEPPPPEPTAPRPPPKPEARSIGPKGTTSPKRTADKVAEVVQTTVLRAIAASNPAGQMDLITGGAISSMTKDALKGIGFSDTDLAALDLWMATGGGGGMGILGELGGGMGGMGSPKPAPKAAAPRFTVGTKGGVPVVAFGEGAPTLGYSKSGPAPSPTPIVLPTAPGSKTVAGTYATPVTTSGWGRASDIPGYNGSVAVGVWKHMQSHGVTLEPHFFDYKNTPGTYNAAHGELQSLYLDVGADFVEVSKAPCCSCAGRGIPFFATTRQMTITVLSPAGFQWFFPDGTHFP